MQGTSNVNEASQPNLVVVIIALSCGTSCAFGGVMGVDEAIASWQAGHGASTLTAVEAVYAGFLRDNDLNEASIQDTKARVVERLDTEPVITPGQALASPIAERSELSSSSLRDTLRADLLSFQVTRMARALLVVKGLELRDLCRFVIAVIYAPTLVEADGGVMIDLEAAQRTMVVKAIALDTLRALQ